MKINEDTKLSIVVIVVAALLLQLNSALEYISTRRDFTEQLTEKAQRDVNESPRIARVKHHVEESLNDILPAIRNQAKEVDVDTLKQLFSKLLYEHKHIVGITIGYVPGYVEAGAIGKDKRYGFYIYQNDEKDHEVKYVRIDEHDYTQRPWYKGGVQQSGYWKSGYWSEPYIGNYSSLLMCSYSKQVHDDDGKLIAIVAADVPLRDLSQMASQFYENQRKSARRNGIFHLCGLLLLGFIVYRMVVNWRHLKASNADKERIANELKIATRIQNSMLPHTFPDKEEDPVEIFASLTPAREVGGDFYDFLMDNDRLIFCIGDVSGKGVPAALLMTVMKTLFTNEARITLQSFKSADEVCDTAAIVTRINQTLSESQSSGFFTTMFVGVLNFKTGRLDYCNAGHEAPILGSELLPVESNLPVGALSDWVYEGQTAMLHEGDTLFLFTDGLSEARNVKGDLFSRERIINLAKGAGNYSARKIVNLMMNTVNRYAEGAEQSDDLTMMAVQWKKGDPALLFSRLSIPCKEGTLTLHTTDTNFPEMKDFVLKVSEDAGLEAREAKRLRLATEEAVINIVNYSHAQTITLGADIDDGMLSLAIIDDGDPFDPTTADVTDTSIPADERRAGGLGLILIRQMTDVQEYRRVDEQNILIIRKKITK